LFFYGPRGTQADPSNDVKRHEIKGDVVVIYFDQIKSAGDTCVDVDVRPAFEVNDVKEAGIKIYDYYQPEHTVSVSYHMPSGTILPLNPVKPVETKKKLRKIWRNPVKLGQTKQVTIRCLFFRLPYDVA